MNQVFETYEEDIESLFTKSVGDKMNDNKRIYECFKRFFDIVLSLLTVILFTPIIFIIGILIRLESEGSVFYSQERIGKYGKVFTIYKLRSMYIDAEKNGIQWAEKDDPRITRIGKFIRKTRLDEIPQFINVLRGDMSIIGPRPERPEFTNQFEQEIPGFVKRLSVKPGLTGLAQVNGGYEISPEEKLQWDMDYINRRGFLLDSIILLKTVKVVFTGEGAR